MQIFQGRAFQVEEIARAKALRWELGRHGGGTTRVRVKVRVRVRV